MEVGRKDVGDVLDGATGPLNPSLKKVKPLVFADFVRNWPAVSLQPDLCENTKNRHWRSGKGGWVWMKMQMWFCTFPMQDYSCGFPLNPCFVLHHYWSVQKAHNEEIWTHSPYKPPCSSCSKGRECIYGMETWTEWNLEWREGNFLSFCLNGWGLSLELPTYCFSGSDEAGRLASGNTTAALSTLDGSSASKFIFLFFVTWFRERSIPDCRRSPICYHSCHSWASLLAFCKHALLQNIKKEIHKVLQDRWSLALAAQCKFLEFGVFDCRKPECNN